MKNLQSITKLINDHFALKKEILKFDREILSISEKLAKILKNKKCIFWCGNGGSASRCSTLIS